MAAALKKRLYYYFMQLSLVFPVFNEADSITGVLEDFSRYLESRSIGYEMLVVDDGSHDATLKRIQDFCRIHPATRCIIHPANQGYGAALRSGFTAAAGDFIFFTDSDGQFRPEALAETIRLAGPDTMVLGYRKGRAEGLARRLNAQLWAGLVGLILGVRVRDLNCAWKLFPRSLLDHITLTSRGAFVTPELLYYAKKQNLNFQELPVQHFPRKSGSPTGANPKVIYRAFQELRHFLRHRSRARQKLSMPVLE